MNKLRKKLLRSLVVTALATSLLTLNGAASAAEDSSLELHSCVQIAQFFSGISAERSQWRRSLLDSLAEPADACEELKLGLLLSHPAVSFQNDSKALLALNNVRPLLSDTAADTAVLEMLITHIKERQALRNLLGATHKNLRSLDQRLQARQLHIDTLEGQIDQLKNLEAQLEDKAREAIEPAVAVQPDTQLDSAPEPPQPGQAPEPATLLNDDTDVNPKK